MAILDCCPLIFCASGGNFSLAFATATMEDKPPTLDYGRPERRGSAAWLIIAILCLFIGVPLCALGLIAVLLGSFFPEGIGYIAMGAMLCGVGMALRRPRIHREQ
jgi:hypothetical protein